MANWWQLEIEEVTKTLEADTTKGLSSDEVKQRLEKFGANQLNGKGTFCF